VGIKQKMMSEKDEKEFEKFHDNFYRRMISVAYVIIGDYFQAEDAVSEAFLRIAKSWKVIKDLSEEQKDYYVYLSAKNSALNILKKEEKYSTTIEYDDTMLSNDSLSGNTDEYIIQQINMLSKNDREILYLRYSMGLDYKAISAALGITVSAARKRIQYAKENLSQLLRIGGVNLE
jgi:RNA polymerase sigma-70 factor (ECF subfamily)